jgi:hypothetical protein
VSIRDPKDALVSAFRFEEGWMFEPGSVSIEESAKGYVRRGARRDYWNHLGSWWPHRGDTNVLMLCYEALNRDAQATVRRVAAFVGITLDDELLDLVLRQSTLEFMLAHKDRFDDRLMRERSERIAALPPGSDSVKVRKGQVGEHKKELPEIIADELDQIWREDIEPKFGFPTYAALTAAPTAGT